MFKIGPCNKPHTGEHRYWGKHVKTMFSALQWRHNEHEGVSNHQPCDCLLNHSIRRRSKKTSKLRVTGLCAGNSPVNSPHKGPVTRKMFPFDDVIMRRCILAMLRGSTDGRTGICINTLRPRQNGSCFADDTLGCIFLNENVSFSIDNFMEVLFLRFELTIFQHWLR